MLKIPSTSSHPLVWTHGNLSLHTLIGIISTALAAAVAVTLVLTKFPAGNKVKDNKTGEKNHHTLCAYALHFLSLNYLNLHISLFTQWKQKALVMDN